MPPDDPIKRVLQRVGRRRAGTDPQKRSVRARLFGDDDRTERVEAPPSLEGLEHAGEHQRRVEERAMRDGGMPTRIGRFVVLGPVGRGGMGTVFRAFDDQLDRQVAIKVVHPEVAELHGRRMRREAQALARLSHPNVVQVYEVGEFHGQPFIAMELVAGRSLGQWQRLEMPDWDACLDVYMQAGQGLAAAHAKGLVHRDFKPSNCILDDEGRVRVLDFGLATDVGLVGPSGSRSGAMDEVEVTVSTSALMQRLTETGSVLGTRAYMAPEQLGVRPADAKSDQFSFCVALYQVLYGQLPFSDDPGPALADMAVGVSRAPLPPPARSRVPRWIQRVLWQGLAADPEERWPSMVALLWELERHRRRRPGLRSVLVAGGVLGVAGVVSLPLLGRSQIDSNPCRDAAELLDGVWGAPHKQRIESAMIHSGLDHGPRTWATLERTLDRYADEWAEAKNEACEATYVHQRLSREEFSLREQCLRVRRSALEYDVELLADADSQMVDMAVDLVTELPRISRCAEETQLAEEARLAEEGMGSSGPGAQRAVEELRASIQRMRALDTVDRSGDALVMLASAIDEAERFGDEGLRAEVQLVGGTLHMSLGQDEEAEQYFVDAREGALRHAADGVALEAMAGWIHLVGVEREKTEDALVLEGIALSLAERYDPDGVMQAKVLTALAQVHTVRGEYRAAETHYLRVLEILGRRGGEGQLALADALDGLAQTMKQQGQLDDAEAYHRRALRISLHLFGPEHYRTAHYRTNFGITLAARGKFSEALPHYKQALGILEGVPNPRDKSIAHTRAALGAAQFKQGANPDAERNLRKALELWGVELGPNQPRVTKVRFDLAVVLNAQRNVDEAMDQYEVVLEGLEHQEPTRDRDLMMARTHRGLGSILVSKQRSDDAESHYREGIDILRGHAGDGSAADPLMGSLLNRLGDLLRARGDVEQARRLYQRALTAYEGLGKSERIGVGHTLRRLARIDLDEERWSVARGRLEKAQAIYRLVAATSKLLEVDAMLAEIPGSGRHNR